MPDRLEELRLRLRLRLVQTTRLLPLDVRLEEFHEPSPTSWRCAVVSTRTLGEYISQDEFQTSGSRAPGDCALIEKFFMGQLLEREEWKVTIGT
jgi:hypothetical protein